MIKLFSGSCFLLDRRGRQRSFSFEDLRGELCSCFQACGVHDAWAEEHIAFVIEEQLARLRREGHNTFAEDELRTLVFSVLCDSGYGDVAAVYRRAYGVPSAPAASDALTAWDDDRIASGLPRSLPLAEADRDILVTRVRDALTSLGLTTVSDEFIRQLGIHFVRSVEAGESARAGGDSSWLFEPEHWRRSAPADLEALATAGVIGFHPVSRLLPRVRLDLDLTRLARTTGTVPLLEIAFLQSLRHTCRQLLELFNGIRSEIVREVPHAAHHPSHLAVLGMARLIVDCTLPMRASAARAFTDEIVAVIRSEVEADAGFELLVTVR